MQASNAAGSAPSRSVTAETCAWCLAREQASRVPNKRQEGIECDPMATKENWPLHELQVACRILSQLDEVDQLKTPSY